MGDKLTKEHEVVGVDCADCANKIEKEICKLKNVEKATFNFATGKLSIEAKDQQSYIHALEEASKIIKNHRPRAFIREVNDLDPAYEDVINTKVSFENILSITGVFLLGFALTVSNPIWRLVLYVMSYLSLGWNVMWKAYSITIKSKILDENFLMTIATLGAFAIGEYTEAVAVMLFYQVGEFLQDHAVSKSRKSIKSIMNIRPEYANLKADERILKVSPTELRFGDIIIVKPGEKVPVDGLVMEGNSTLDTSILTGESMPKDVSPGDDVLSGAVNISGLLTVRVSREYSESAVSRVMHLVEQSVEKKARTERFISRFAKVYTPIVAAIALIMAVIPPLLLQDQQFETWVYRALIFLVVSCPCALVISVPLGFFGGIGGAARKGILVKGGDYLDALSKAETIIFDKTGTLTKGEYKVGEVIVERGFDKETIMDYAAIAESFSIHPIAESILKEYGEDVDLTGVEGYTEYPGLGIKVVVEGKEILAGNKKLLAQQKVDIPVTIIQQTAVYLAVNNKFAGMIVIKDVLKEEAPQAILDIRRIGIKKIVILTGDAMPTAARVAEALGIRSWFADLLPEHKVEKLETYLNNKSKKGKVVFVGDGINDAPVLARADVGIAMGGVGSEAAIESADIVIMNDDISKVPEAISHSRKTMRIVRQNVIFAFGVKVAVLVLGALGMAEMWQAVIADVGVTLMAVINSIRTMR